MGANPCTDSSLYLATSVYIFVHNQLLYNPHQEGAYIHMDVCIASTIIIDYRATYVYGIGNGRALPIVLHWAALKHSPEYLAFAKIN